MNTYESQGKLRICKDCGWNWQAMAENTVEHCQQCGGTTTKVLLIKCRVCDATWMSYDPMETCPHCLYKCWNCQADRTMPYILAHR